MKNRRNPDWPRPSLADRPGRIGFVVTLLFLGFVFLVCSAIAAFALDFSKPVLTLEGTPMTVCLERPAPTPEAPRPQCARSVPLTVGRVIATVLLSPSDEKAPDVVEVARRGDLARKIYQGTEPVELAAEDIAYVKRHLAKLGPLLASQVLPLLDPGHAVNGVKTETVP